MESTTTHPISPVLKELGFDQIANLDQELLDGEGWEFYSNGQIRCATVFENKLSGRVGNFVEEYEVEITVLGEELRASCNCSRAGTICKHVIALLHCWVNDSEGFLNVGDSITELYSYNKERLLEIVTNIIRHDPKNIERFLSSEPTFDDSEYGMNEFENN